MISLTKSGDYCIGLLESGISISIINDLMLDEKKVQSFGITLNDLKSLKIALNIYERLIQIFNSEDDKDAVEALIQEVEIF